MDSRKLLAAAALILVSACASPAPTPSQGPSAPTPTPVSPTATLPAPEPDPVATAPEVVATDSGFTLRGLEEVGAVAWSPSGKLAVLSTGAGQWLLDTTHPSLRPLPDTGDAYPLAYWDAHSNPLRPRFWTESTVAWHRLGATGLQLMVSDLKSGTTRAVHRFPLPATHFVRPGELRIVYHLHNSVTSRNTSCGPVMTGELGKEPDRTLLENGRLLGRLAGGQVVVVEGCGAGRIGVTDLAGQFTWLTDQVASQPAISPDGKQLLWFTAPSRISLRPLLGPAVAHADPRGYDFGMDTLWVWGGSGAPTRIPLGGEYVVDALFEPDGRRVALALNGLGPGEDRPLKPGFIAVVDGMAMQRLAEGNEGVRLHMWSAGEVVFQRLASEKTGGQPPLVGVDTAGTEKTWSTIYAWDASYTLTRDGAAYHLIRPE